MDKMSRVFPFLVLILTTFCAYSEDYIESYNLISDNYVNRIQDVQIIRPINGGTVITPVFDTSCPEEMKAPFSYACKIVEEYMPPCLPLKVKVSCGRVNGSSANIVSKVLAHNKRNFGTGSEYKRVQMSVIKGVILAELCYNSDVTYLKHVPDLEFLTELPDIEITYNNQKLNDISYALDANPGEKYDFVSLAIRDLMIGLGLSSSFRYNSVTKELLDPSNELTPFESYIDKILGNYDNPSARLLLATKGELLLEQNKENGLKLYAPNPWQNGSSLNYFIPQEDCCISNILSYDFCKGVVTRSLKDNYTSFIFRDLLGWKPNFLTGSSTPTVSAGGSTSQLMPYNGSISFNDDTYGICTVVDTDASYKISKASDPDDNIVELMDYIDLFHPFQHNDGLAPAEGISISVLKKDGSWDLVKFLDIDYPDLTFSMSDWDFHYDESQYARTIDGYLRARITTKKIEYGSRIKYISKFFVIDYLPQKVNLSYAFVTPDTNKEVSRTASAVNTVRIYFSNTEGITRLLLEKLRKGSRVPSKIDVTDFKKGYFETTIDRTTTFTAIGYNSNGTSRGVSITVTLPSNEQTIDFKMADDFIYLETEEPSDSEYNYSISPLDVSMSNFKQTGITTGKIDISDLAEGIYVLNVQDNKSGLIKSFKFKK